MPFKQRLAKHLDITGDDALKWSPICQEFWNKYYFLIGLVFVISLGAAVPAIGHKGGPLETPITSSWIAVCIIFFVTGLGVKTQEIKKATLYWQLNLFVHFFIYVYHPCIGFAVTSTLNATTDLSPYILDGLLITLCLPTTISSAVVLTVNASGNEAAAVVNTAVANILGIFITPALIFIFLGNLGSVDIGDVFFKLALRVLAPFGVGQLIRNIGGDRVKSYIKKIKKWLKKTSETLLLYIIFCAISESLYTGLDAGLVDIVAVFVMILCIHVLTLVVVWYLSGVRGPPSSEYNTLLTDQRKKSKCCSKKDCMRFTLYDRIAILFCASQKTAAFGIPIVSSLFESSQYLGIYLMPLLIYHPLQLIIDSFLVQPLALKVSRYEKAKQLTKGDEDDNRRDVHEQDGKEEEEEEDVTPLEQQESGEHDTAVSTEHENEIEIH